LNKKGVYFGRGKQFIGENRMAENKMILYPKNPHALLGGMNRFLNGLMDIGLINEEFEYYREKNCFRQGKKFLELIKFLEVRKSILVDKTHPLEDHYAVDNSTTCFVQAKDFGNDLEILGVMNSYTNPPVCPSCGNKIIDFSTVISEWYENKNLFLWTCKQCNSKMHIYDLDWKQGLGFAHYCLDIWHIHFQEAVPSEEFLKSLYDITGQTWIYFYFRF
jgi:hypothetical protein